MVVPLMAGQPSGTNGAGGGDGVVVVETDELVEVELVDVTLTGYGGRYGIEVMLVVGTEMTPVL